MSSTLSGDMSFAFPNTLDNLSGFEEFGGNYLNLDGSSMMAGDLDMGSYKIKNVASAAFTNEAVNLGQLSSSLTNYVTLNTTQTIPSIKTIYNNASTNAWGLGTADGLNLGTSSKTGTLKLYGTVNTSIFQQTNSNLHIDLSNNLSSAGMYLNYYSPNSQLYLAPRGTGNCLIGTTALDSSYKAVIDRNTFTNALKINGNVQTNGNLDMATNTINNLANGTLTTDAVNLGQLTSGLTGYVTLNTDQTITSTKTIDPVSAVSQIIMRKSALTDTAMIKFRETTSNIWDFGMKSGSDNHMHLYHIPTANYMHYWTTTGRYGIGGAPTDKFSIFNGSQTITRTDNLPALLNITSNSNSSGLGSIISLSSLDVRSSGVKYASTTNTAKQFYMGRPYRQATNTESRFVLGYVNTAGQDPAFEVGGTGIRNYTPLIAADGDNARVGINTITPLSSFHVTGNTTITSGTLDMTSNKVINVTDPTSAQDAATKNYVDTYTGANYVTTGTAQTVTGAKTFQSAGTSTQKLILDRTSGTIDNVVTFTTPSGINWLMGQSGGSDELSFFRYNGFAYFNKMRISNLTTEIFTELIMASNKITSLANGTNANDAVNKSQLDTKLNLSGGTLTGALSMNTTNRITNLADPTNNQDAVTKKYVDDNLLNITAVKTTNFTYAGEDVIYWNSSISVSMTINALSTYKIGQKVRLLISNTSTTNVRNFFLFLPGSGSDYFIYGSSNTYLITIGPSDHRIVDLTFNNFNGSFGSVWSTNNINN